MRGLVQRLSRLVLADHPEFQASIATNHLLVQTRTATGLLAGFWTRLKRFWGRAQGLSERVERLLNGERPDIVFVDHTWLAPLVWELIPRHDECLWMLDTHDCLHLRDQSLAAAGLPLESVLSPRKRRHCWRRLTS